MDHRTTLYSNDSFVDILSNCMQAKTKVALLLDDDGLIRAEGFIKALHFHTLQPYIEMQSGLKIVFKTIKAVNGIFAHEFSEC